MALSVFLTQLVPTQGALGPMLLTAMWMGACKAIKLVLSDASYYQV